MKINFANFKDKSGCLSPQLIKSLVDIIHVSGEETLFLESGTYLGGTVEALKKYFDKVYSIELDKDLYQRAQQRFAKEKNITILQGDAGQKIKEVLKNIKKANIIFWLDGHYSGEGTARGNINTPIVAELQAIAQHDKGQKIILVDDIRLFLGDDYYQKSPRLKNFVAQGTSLAGYPSFYQLLLLVEKLFPHHGAWLMGDMLLVLPKALLKKVTISPVVMAATQLRCFPEHQLSASLLANYRKAIMMVTGIEKQTFFDFFKQYHVFDNGLAAYYHWWIGLIYQASNKKILAKYHFYLAQRNGLSTIESRDIVMAGLAPLMLLSRRIIKKIKKNAFSF